MITNKTKITNQLDFKSYLNGLASCGTLTLSNLYLTHFNLDLAEVVEQENYEKIIFDNCFIENLSFFKLEWQCEIQFNASVIKQFTAHQTQFLKPVSLQGFYASKVHLMQCEFVLFDLYQIPQLQVHTCEGDIQLSTKMQSSLRHRIQLTDYFSGNLQLNATPQGTEFEQLTLAGKIGASIDICHGIFEQLTLSQTQTDGTVHFAQCQVKNLAFIKHHNLVGQNMVFRQLTPLPGSRILIENASLNAIQFINCCTSEFDQLQYESGDLSNILLANSRLPKKVVFPHKNSSFERQYYQQYRRAVTKMGDKYETKHARRQELNALLTQRPRTITWPTTCSLWGSKLSANHSTNWLQPVMIAIFFSVIIATTTLYLNPHTDLSFNHVLHDTFHWLNPARKASLLISYQGMEQQAWFEAFNACSRLLLGYLYYQTIRAFRLFD
ncbi:hypothetical protein [Motilimonas pumila]|uniref:Uncharacterized protein n=1 Tax=Motilimonas pumila TaxID=2303987 RepID=A0A418YKJ6_9GAMM|nr:hypothetical protein [Motilimonas pumila]RJG51469.1 hypothetical protein D1Z90_01685 [Motilimonas pumila]